MFRSHARTLEGK